MRLTRPASLRWRLRQKRNKTRFWDLAAFRRSRQSLKGRLKRDSQRRNQLEYVVLAKHRLPEEHEKLVA